MKTKTPTFSFWCTTKVLFWTLGGLIGLSEGSIGQQPEEGWAHSGNWKFEVRADGEGGKEVWIVQKEGGGEKKLANTMGWGNLRVHISPDDKTIVLQDGGGSIGIDLRVFQSKGDKFRETVKTKIGNVLERWALSKTKAPSDLILGHRYVKLHGWSADSKKALVSISGHEGKWQIPGWYAIYNFDTGMLSFDLGEFNR